MKTGKRIGKAVICLGLVIVSGILVVNGVRVMGAGKQVLAAKDNICVGTILSKDNMDEYLEEKECKEDIEGVEAKNIMGIDGSIVIKDIRAGDFITMDTLAEDYPPISDLTDPVVVGIRANDPSQFSSGTIRRGDLINVSVIDNMTNECECIARDVFVCGAYSDDGTFVEEEGCATILNILVDAKTEEKINEKIEKGRVRVSRVGSDVY